ncbi:MAG: ABC transporter ATP-binding protein, partial [Myxococcota bacterium]
VAHRIGYLPEVAPIYRDLSVRESLRFVARLKSVERSKITAECERVMQQVGLLDVADRLLRNLSKGYQQRCGLAQALISEPEVLILDEPTVGLDPRQIGEVRNLIRGLAGSHTVFLSTHMLTEVAAVCERAVIIHRGRIVADDRLDNLAHAEDAGSLEQAFLRLTGD